VNLASLPFFAEEASRMRFEWGRIQSNSDWILPIAAFMAIMTFVRWMYRRDAQELGPLWRWLLTALRTVAFLGLLILYLEPQWRTEREVVHPSRVVLMVDTSLSMGLTDDDASAGLNRSRQVAAALAGSDFLHQLRTTHEVVVMRFDEALGRLVLLGRLPPRSETPSADDAAEAVGPNASDAPSPGDRANRTEAGIDWESVLKPVGKETRIGQSLQQVISDQHSAPVAGIIIVSDGGQNAGPPPEAAMELAREARIPVYPVGVGSARRPVNVRVYELEAPERAHPGDPYRVTAMIQSQGLAGQSIPVQFLIRDPAKGTEQLVDTQQVILGRDGESVPVKFQATPTETGRRQIVVRVVAPKSDRNPADDRREVDVEIVDRKNHVLLFAGGPTREYQFLKALLYRDKSTTLDVLLQTARPGISQEAAKILDKFPETRQAMYGYDCVVAFDPQWQALSPAQIDLLESWVGEQGGGLVVIAGPIHTGQTVMGWVQSPAMAKIRGLYPVEFQRRATAMEGETYVSKDPWPLDFTREGREAEFLWLAETESASQQAWAAFPGVYSCQPVRAAKAGATVFARFSDPEAPQSGPSQPGSRGMASRDHAGGQLPYFVGQFYGAGRVFYMGSGEMWRLRRVEEGAFEQFYTRLIRHVSQGRLLRQSSRGSLLVDKDRALLGGTAEIRAQLTDAQLKPLKAANVPLEVIQPDRGVQTIALRADPAREGMYSGQLTLLQEGAYRLELPVPESAERIVRRIQVRLPDLERENPQRNDSLLGRIAAGSGGKYYSTLGAAWGPDADDPLVDHLRDRTRISIVSSGPNPLSERPWMAAMMLILCGLLCIEWLVRRLLKLA